MSTRDEKREAIRKHREARARLAEVSSRIQEETPEYLDANAAVIEAERNIPWYRR